MPKNTDKRNEEIIALLTEENRQLRENRLPREYCFAPVAITAEEKKILGELKDSPAFDLITKWFKLKADQNNDLLLHGNNFTEEQKCLLRLAVLVFDDWNSFMANCK